MSEDDDNFSPRINKSEMKQEMAAIQKLALTVTELKPAEYNYMALDADVREQFDSVRSIKSLAARRRGLRTLARLLANGHYDEVLAAYRAIKEGRDANNNRFRELEKARDAIVAGSPEAIETLLEKFPQMDRQHLRNLQRNARKEKTEAGVTRAARIIFQYLRDHEKNS